MTDESRVIAAALLVLAAVLVVVVLVFGLRGCSPDRPTTPTTPTVGGCPLDAMSYDTPVWMPECVRCQRITDRVTGCRWWVLTMCDGEHVVLPLDETEGK